MLHTKRSAGIDKKYELAVLENADEIISVSEPISRMFQGKSSMLRKEKFHVIPNGFDENDFKIKINASVDFFLITYVGTIADSYNPELFFRILSRVISEFPDIPFKFRLVGSLPGSVRELVKKYDLERNTEFISHVSHEKAIEYMIGSSALLLIIPDVDGSEGILTGKLFEYLASRRPIIGIGPSNGSAAMIIHNCTAGRMYSRSEEEQNYSYLKSLVLQWKQNKELYNDNEEFRQFSRSALTEKLASIILKKN